MIVLGPLEQDASAIPFNQHVFEIADEAIDHEPELEALAATQAPAPQRAPLAFLPSKNERCARQAADREVRDALLQHSDDCDSSDPFAELSAYVDVTYSES